MTPEQSKALGQMMANRPPTVSTTTTTSIKSQSLPTDTFSVPSGFTKKEFNMPGLGGMGSPGAGAAGAPGGAKPPAGGDD
jgi:hypothetical protein